MAANIEREVKLGTSGDFSLYRLAELADGYRASPIQVHRLHTVYYDTEDLRLARWGCSLRYRYGEGWTLKVPRAGDTAGLTREEHTFEGPPDAPPAAALDLVAAFIRGAPVRPVAELRTLRQSLRLAKQDRDDVAEVVADDVRVVEDRQVARRFRQIEIELLDEASADVLEALTTLAQEAGAGEFDPVPKDVRALGERAAAPPDIVSGEIGPKLTSGEAVRLLLAASVQQLILHDPVIRLDKDPEAIHQARIAVRRLRSHLRTFLPVLDHDWACGLRERLEWLGDELGKARDADVELARLQQRMASLPAEDAAFRERELEPFPFQEQRRRAHAEVLEALHDPRYHALLEDLVEAGARPRLSQEARSPARRTLPELVGKRWKQLRRTSRRLSEPPADQELHRLRIRAKHCRYAAEAVVGLCGEPACVFAKHAKKLQDILGEQHDAVVEQQRLRDIAAAAREAFIAGQLFAIERQVSEQARADWPRAYRKLARKRDHFWR